jgi:hypothetical protein
MRTKIQCLFQCGEPYFKLILKSIKFTCFSFVLIFLCSCKTKKVSVNPIPTIISEAFQLNKDTFPYSDLKYDQSIHNETNNYHKITGYYQKYCRVLNVEQRSILTKFMLDFASTPLSSSSIWYYSTSVRL